MQNNRLRFAAARMGLILDSSVIIAAERRGETAEQLIERILRATGDQDAALSAVGLTELVHGIGSRLLRVDGQRPTLRAHSWSGGGETLAGRHRQCSLGCGSFLGLEICGSIAARAKVEAVLRRHPARDGAP
jgi:hypothetical protein